MTDTPVALADGLIAERVRLAAEEAWEEAMEARDSFSGVGDEPFPENPYRLPGASGPMLLVEVERLRAQRDAVLELHYPVEDTTGMPVCSHRYCVDGSLDQVEWPCPTARALGVDE